jgi:hypothetical protein
MSEDKFSEKRGDWLIYRQGQKLWYAHNETAGLYFKVEYKANLEKTFKKVVAALERDPNSVPPPCQRTRERREEEEKQYWNSLSYADRLARADSTVIMQIKNLMRRGKETKERATSFDAIQRMTKHDIISILALEQYREAFDAESPEERLETVKRQEEHLRNAVLRFGFQPSYADSWSRGWEYLHYQALVSAYNEFDAMLHLYRTADGEN